MRRTEAGRVSGIGDDPAVQAFLAAASAYCGVIETRPGPGQVAAFLASVQPLLPGWEGGTDAERRGIVWDWRFGYESLWGHPAIDAMRAIHSLLYLHHPRDPAGPDTPS